MTLAFKRIHPDAVLPAYAHEGDAGMDVRSVEDVTVPACGRALVHTGLVMLLPAGYEAQVRPRSGLALKSGITVLNTPGTMDSGYRGEIGVILFNSSKTDFSVRKNDRVAHCADCACGSRRGGVRGRDRARSRRFWLDGRKMRISC